MSAPVMSLTPATGMISLKRPLALSVEDTGTGLKSVQVTAVQGGRAIELFSRDYPAGTAQVTETLSLTGKVNPSGRLPMTFPVNEQQTPRPQIPGLGEADGTATTIAYTEGANVGYRWFATTSQRPLFPFGHGLSFTRFEHGSLTVTAGETIRAQFTVKNVGDREGADVPQLYLLGAAGKRIQRLAGFDKVTLRPGERREIHLEIDPRLLADWNGDGWLIRAGSYGFAVGRSAAELGPAATVELVERRLKP
jgi:beta-glucosidase